MAGDTDGVHGQTEAGGAEIDGGAAVGAGVDVFWDHESVFFAF